jgi:putative superfamily III holin-X
MVDQAQVTPTNDRTELPSRAVARSASEFLHDVATLTELQGKLALIEFREGVAKLITPVIALSVGAAIGLGCVPIALAALALMLKEITTLSLATCFGISLAVGLFISAVLTIVAFGVVKSSLKMFDRSLYELGRNAKWVKDTLKRLSQSGPKPLGPRSHPKGW